MKRVLILSYYYGQAPNAGGAVRVQKFVKYLPEFGWQPVILTTPSQLPCRPRGTEGREFFATRSKVEIRGHPIISSYLWLPAAVRAATKIIEREEIDIVLANCDPFVASIAAVHVSQRCNVPSMADFRDAWSFHPYSQGSKFLSSILESYVLRRIHFLTTTSPGTTEEYITRYPFLASKIHTLYNGFDEEDFPQAMPVSFEQFTIASAGTLYTSRTLQVLFEAMGRLVDRPIRLVLIGNARGDIAGLAAKREIGQMVEVHARTDQRDAIREVCRAHMTLVMRRPTRMRCTPIATKTFEYIRAGLPILAIMPEGSNAAFLREHASQAHVITSYSADEVAAAIQQCYQDWQTGNLVVRRNPAWEAHWNRRELARQLGGLLDRVSSNQVGTTA